MTPIFFQLIFTLGSLLSLFGPASQPTQPLNGPGGAAYAHQSVTFQDFAAKEDGYFLFEPAEPAPDSAHVIVFLHGYGGYNPMIYGKWVRHLVQNGNIVIYPRYQENLFSPGPEKFAENSSKAIRDALTELRNEGHVKPVVSHLALLGHSYGGVIATDLAINFEKHEIPAPKVVMLCSPGTGKLKGGRLDSYDAMPAHLSLLITVSQDDWVVGDEFALKVFREATNVQQRNLLRQFPDPHGEPAIEAHHNQTYSLDTAFDNGVRNYSAKKALRISTVDVVDFNGYWKLFDAMLACNRQDSLCNFAFGGTPEQTSLGVWSDGVPVRALEVTLPE